jgi:tetratricopeptide (TPR) repeat protein
MPVIVALIVTVGALRMQTAAAHPVPDLPRLSVEKFQPVVREQVQEAYSAAQTNPQSAGASGNLGMILETYEQYEAAAVCYRRAHALDPHSFRWLFYLGWAQATLGRHNDAAITLTEALRLQSDYVPAQLKLAESLFTVGRLDESRDLYERILKEHQSVAEAHYGLGRVRAAQGDLALATASLLKACELFPAYGAAHYALALTYRKLGKAAEAQQHFRLSEQNKTAIPRLDDSLRNDIARLNIGSVGHIRRAVDLERAGKIAEAIAEEQQALSVDPQAVQAHINLISLYGRIGQYENAADHYRAAFDLNSNQADLHYNYGVLLLKQGKNEDAERAFQEAVRINPYYAEARINLGSLYEQQGRFDQALRQFTAAIENRPDLRAAHFHIGRILANQERYDEAIQHLLDALTPENEETPRYLYALGATYARSGDLPKALKYIRAAREQAASRGQSQLLASIEKDLKTLEAAAGIKNRDQP